MWKQLAKQRDHISFSQAEIVSPYREISEVEMRKLQDQTESKINVNGYYRYANVIDPLFSDESISAPVKDWMFDNVYHMLVEMEFLSGMTREEMKVRTKVMQIEQGVYGKSVTDCFATLSSTERYLTGSFVCKQDMTGACLSLFADFLIRLLGKGVLYQKKEEQKELLLYVGNQKNVIDRNKILLVTELALPLEYNLTTFWDKHFSVIGEDATMKIDHMIID